MMFISNNNYEALFELADERIDDLSNLTGDLFGRGSIDKEEWSMLCTIEIQLRNICEELSKEMKKRQKQNEKLKIQNDMLSTY